MNTQLTIQKQTRRLFLVWTIFATGLVTIIIKQNLDPFSYFRSNTDWFQPSIWVLFLTDRARVLILSAVCLATFFLLTKDSGKWREIGEGCFSQTAMPVEWTRVYGGSIIKWIVLSNIVVFLAMAYFTNWLVVFSALLAVHHANGIAWIHCLRRNVSAYFANPTYAVPPNDPHSPFIHRQRDAVRKFFFEEWHTTRHLIVITASLGAMAITFAENFSQPLLRVAPYALLCTGVVVGLTMVTAQRWRRDVVLASIEKDRLAFDASREKDGV